LWVPYLLIEAGEGWESTSICKGGEEEGWESAVRSGSLKDWARGCGDKWAKKDGALSFVEEKGGKKKGG